MPIRPSDHGCAAIHSTVSYPSCSLPQPSVRYPSLEEFRRGLAVEFENGSAGGAQTNVTADDPIRTGRIALAHLRERPDYYRMLARYGYICGLVGLILLAIPAVLPDSVAEQYGAKIWIRFPGFSIQPAEFSKILLLIFFASVLVTKRSLFTSAGKHMFGMDLPRPRDLAPLLAGAAAIIGILIGWIGWLLYLVLKCPPPLKTSSPSTPRAASA